VVNSNGEVINLDTGEGQDNGGNDKEDQDKDNNGKGNRGKGNDGNNGSPGNSGNAGNNGNPGNNGDNGASDASGANSGQIYTGDLGLIYNGSEDSLLSAPSFSAAELDNLGNGDSTGKLDEFLDVGEGQGRPYVLLNKDSQRLSDREGNYLGDIRTWVADLGRGRLAYAVLETGNIFNRQYVLVPFNKLDWSEAENGQTSLRLQGNPRAIERAPHVKDLDSLVIDSEQKW
jgi:hypothetical protein